MDISQDPNIARIRAIGFGPLFSLLNAKDQRALIVAGGDTAYREYEEAVDKHQVFMTTTTVGWDDVDDWARNGNTAAAEMNSVGAPGEMNDCSPQLLLGDGRVGEKIEKRFLPVDEEELRDFSQAPWKGWKRVVMVNAEFLRNEIAASPIATNSEVDTPRSFMTETLAESVIFYSPLVDRSTPLGISYSDNNSDVVSSPPPFELGDLLCFSRNLKRVSFYGLNWLTSCKNLLYFTPSLTTVSFEGLVSLRSCCNILSSCSALRQVNFKGLDNLQSCHKLLGACTSIEHIVDFNGLGRLKSCLDILEVCTSLTTVESFRGLESLETCGNILQKCKALESVNFEGLGQLKSCNNLLVGCSSLTSVGHSVLSDTNKNSNCSSSDSLFSTVVDLQGLVCLEEAGCVLCDCSSLEEVRSFKGLENLVSCGDLLSECESLREVNFVGLNQLRTCWSVFEEGCPMDIIVQLPPTETSACNLIQGLLNEQALKRQEKKRRKKETCLIS